MNTIGKFAVLVSFAFAATLSRAAVITLDFEGVGDMKAVGNFYNGGAGTNYGIQFSDNALGLVDSDNGGSGNIGGEPSPSTVLFFLEGSAATLNYAAGFDTGFSFYYSAPYYTGSITVWDGLNGTGNILASLKLPTTYSNGGDPTGSYSPLYAIGVSFEGLAKSVDFSGTANYIVFDNITFGSATPGGVPDGGSTALLLLGGLLGLLGFIRRK